MSSPLSKDKCEICNTHSPTHGIKDNWENELHLRLWNTGIQILLPPLWIYNWKILWLESPWNGYSNFSYAYLINVISYLLRFKWLRISHLSDESGRPNEGANPDLYQWSCSPMMTSETLCVTNVTWKIGMVTQTCISSLIVQLRWGIWRRTSGDWRGHFRTWSTAGVVFGPRTGAIRIYANLMDWLR